MITCARLEIMPVVRSVSMSRVCNRLTDFNEIQNLALSTGECKNEPRTVFQLQREVRDPQVRYTVLLTSQSNSDGHSRPALKIMKFMYATIVCAQFPVSFANVCAPTPTTYTGWICKQYISAG